MSNKPIFHRQKQSSQRGQSLMEMALLLPLLLMLIIGGLEFGRLFYTKTIITNAAREGAYYLSINPSDYTNMMMVIQAEANNSGLSNITVPLPTVGESSVKITVETTVENIFILGFLSSSVFNTTATTATTATTTNSGDFTLISTVEMMIQ